MPTDGLHTRLGRSYGLSTPEYFKRLGLALPPLDQDVFGRPADVWIIHEDEAAKWSKVIQNTMNPRRNGKTRMAHAWFEWVLGSSNRNAAALRAWRLRKPGKYRHLLGRSR